jgi:DUF4097 and DUF4098 domain-containing protein YvlB
MNRALNRIMTLAILAVLALSLQGTLEASELTEQFSEIHPFSSGSSFSLSNVSGDIVISTWDREECEIKAVKKISVTGHTDKAREFLEEIKIRVEKTGKGIVVETEYPSSGLMNAIERLLGGGANMEVSYEIKLPRRADLEVRSVSGDVNLAGFEGKTEVELVSGNMKLEGLAGKEHLKSVSGNIWVKGHTGPLYANTVSGDIEINQEQLQASDSIECNSISGEIVFRLPADIGLDVDLGTISGTISFERAQAEFKGEIEDNSLDGKIKGGGPLIKANTVSGDITL